MALLVAIGVLAVIVALLFWPLRYVPSRIGGWHCSLGVRRDKELGRYVVEERSYHPKL